MFRTRTAVRRRLPLRANAPWSPPSTPGLNPMGHVERRRRTFLGRSGTPPTRYDMKVSREGETLQPLVLSRFKLFKSETAESRSPTHPTPPCADSKHTTVDSSCPGLGPKGQVRSFRICVFPPMEGRPGNMPGRAPEAGSGGCLDFPLLVLSSSTDYQGKSGVGESFSALHL